MCLITQYKTPQILENDLIVYKEMKYYDSYKNPLSSYHQGFTYELNKLYSTTITFGSGTPISWQSYDIKSANAITSFLKGRITDGQMVEDVLICIVEGFHFFFTPERIPNHSYSHVRKIVECTVPAGSIIYKDSTGLGVSNQIILNKIL